MTPDYYATLGLSPTSEDVVIRAAYRALMRRYHPDGNASSSAAARARSINIAYGILIDPAKRAEYDRVRAAEAWPLAPLRRSPLTAPSRWFAAVSVAVLLVVVFLITWSPLSLVKPTEHVAFVPPRIPALIKDIPILPSPAPAPEVAALPEVSDAPVADPQLDEPPPLPAPPPIVAPTRLAAQTAAPKPRAVRPAPPQPVVAAAPAKAPAKTPAKTPAQTVVNANADLASLDQQQGRFYNQSWLRADAARRARLQATRTRFIARRDECRSTACSRAAYLDRIREVGQIMMKPVKPAD